MRRNKIWFGAFAVLVAACNVSSNSVEGLRVSNLTAAQCQYFDTNGTVTLCHATGSRKHPYTVLKVNKKACVNGHAGHCGDYVAVGDPTCDGGGCLPTGAPCDATLPCCDGLSCTGGICVAPPSPCAGTGGGVCSVANTLFTCASGDACDHPVCAAGYANCNHDSPNCETAIGASGGCFPHYLGSYAASTLYSSTRTSIGTDGAYYLAGSFAQTTDFDPGPGVDLRSPQGPYDLYLAKFHADGTYDWALTWGSTDSYTSPLRLSVSGTAVVLSGYFQNEIDLDPGPGTLLRSSPVGGWPTFVVSLTLDGSLNWGAALETTSTCAAEGLALDSAGDVYLAGSYTANCDLDPGPAVNAPPGGFFQRGFAVKLSGTDGTHLWSTTLDGPDYPNIARAAAVSSDGTLWIGGDSNAGDSVITSLASDGTVRFARALTGGSTGAMAIAAASDGSIYVGGQGVGTVDFDWGPGTAARVLLSDGGANPSGSFVLKLAADGAFAWVQTLPKAGFIALAPTPDAGVIVATLPRDPVSYETQGTLITKLAADSGAVWSLSSGGPGSALNDIATGSTTFSVAGAAEEPSDLDPGPAVDAIPGQVTFFSRFSY